MKLLLHGCCADCTLKYLESIKKSLIGRRSSIVEETEECEVVVYYYNPNIHPRSEYQARLKAMQQICEEQKVKLVIPDWSPKEWFGMQKARNEKLETGDLNKAKRCPRCWDLRIGRTADYAKEKGYGYFSTTLVTSQYQNREVVKAIALSKAKEVGIEFFVPEVICCELETKGFYKQFFCGCVYSMVERYEEKYTEEKR